MPKPTFAFIEFLIGIGLLLHPGCGNRATDSEKPGWVEDEPPMEDEPAEWEEMVLIPAGSFLMGDSFNEGDSDEQPVHPVTVDAFYMARYEVTNAQYRAYDPSHDSGSFWGYTFNGYTQPVVYVSWWDAIRYCNWRSRQEGVEECYNDTTGECNLSKHGYRLPTEAEWEYAARGGVEGMRYVWGDGPPPSGAASVGDETAKRHWPDWMVFEGYDDGYAVTAPVGSFSPNGYGLYDMAGNVWEWVNDWYDSRYYSRSPASNSTGPNTGTYRVVRGGSWDDYPFNVRCSNRNVHPPLRSNDLIGFRYARTP